MNITFLIGNGFDLNLGLKTKYDDFLKIYKNQVASNPVIEDFKGTMANDPLLWSNAELAFGKCTELFHNATTFCDCHTDFCVELAKYLDIQESQIYYDSLVDVIPVAFAKSIQSLSSGFREEQQQQIQGSVKAVSGEFVYNFISFNYTKTLDKCVRLTRGKSLLGRRTSRGVTSDNRFGALLHVHGFTDRDMVLGVNDESQIANMKLFEGEPEEFLGEIIKRKTNQLNEEHMDEKCAALLNESDLIYVYGMSIGETDAIWWERICERLKENRNTRVIIHVFNAPSQELIRTRYLQYERSMKENFVKFSKLSEEEKKLIMQRIHISPYNLFDPIKDLVNHKENKSKVLVVTG